MVKNEMTVDKERVIELRVESTTFLKELTIHIIVKQHGI